MQHSAIRLIDLGPGEDAIVGAIFGILVGRTRFLSSRSLSLMEKPVTHYHLSDESSLTLAQQFLLGS